MRKFLITTFFVVALATPAAAQTMGTSTPVAMAPARPVTARPAPARTAPRPAPVARPATMKPAAVVMAPVMAPAAPVAPVAAMTTPATAPVQPAMAAASTTPTKVAPAAKKDSKGSVIGGWLLQLLLGIIGIVVTTISYPLVRWLLKKMKVEDQKAVMMVDDIVDKAVGVGIHYANEQAHKLKDNPVDSAKKLDMAAKKADAYLKDSKIVDKGAQYLKDLIESKLGEERSKEFATATITAGVDEKPTEEKKEDKLEEKADDK